MKPIFAGIDVGERKGQTLVAINKKCELIVVKDRISVSALMEEIQTINPIVIAIDSPPKRALPGRQYRKVEEILPKMGISIRFTSSQNPESWMKVGFDIYNKCQGYTLYLGNGSKGQSLIEIYPYASYVVLSGSRRNDLTKAEWTKKVIADQIGSYDEIANQDKRDALIAAFTAHKFYANEFSWRGDTNEGIIILPMKENDLKDKYK